MFNGSDFAFMEYTFFAAIGFILSLPIVLAMALVGIFFPTLFSWIWLPMLLGFVGGYLFGVIKQ